MAEDRTANPAANPRILILGASGQLGHELQRSFAGLGPIVAAGREAADLADASQIRALVRRVEPDLILNAAAYTDVDRAESEPGLAHAINAEAPCVLAEEAARGNALLVHYSTDYVFDGFKLDPWTEDDLPNPLNAYGASKLAGEQAIRGVGCRALIFRASWVYSPRGKNFLLTMLRLARERERISIVDDQSGAPTSAFELARATRAVVGGVLSGDFGPPRQWTGIYHMTCSGSTSWFGFAQAIFERAATLLNVKAPELVPVRTAEFPTPARRPRNSILCNGKLQINFGVELVPWQSALDQVLQAIRDPASTSTEK